MDRAAPILGMFCEIYADGPDRLSVQAVGRDHTMAGFDHVPVILFHDRSTDAGRRKHSPERGVSVMIPTEARSASSAASAGLPGKISPHASLKICPPICSAAILPF